MIRVFHHPWAWTTLAPLACAAHCVATPFVVAIAPMVLVGPRVEWGLFGTTVVFATLALRAGFRVHGKLGPLGPIALGAALWAASLLHFFQPLPEELTTSAAALTAAFGLVWNSGLHCATRAAACSACAADEALPAGAVESGELA